MKQTYLRSQSALLHLLCLAAIWCLGFPSLTAQSLQWSQFTGTNKGTGTYAIEKVPNGPIYTLSQIGINGSGAALQFNTTDVSIFGITDRLQTVTALTKYSADGSTMEWVRILGPTASNSGFVIPKDLALSPTNEPVVVLKANTATSELITADAWQPNPPSGGTWLVLAKFSASGALTQGTYVGPAGGSMNVQPFSPTNSQSPQHLKVGADGKVYLAFATRKGTGIFPTTAGAIMTGTDPTRPGTWSDGNEHLMIFNPDNTLAYSTYLPTSINIQNIADLDVAPNGDVYILSSAEVTAGLLPPPTTPVGEKGSILHFSSTGQLLGGTYYPRQLLNLTDTRNDPYGISIRPNGNVVVVTLALEVLEYNSTLTTLVSQANPFGLPGLTQPFDMGLDAAGRIHISARSFPGDGLPTTPGAIRSDGTKTSSYYAIVDCNAKDLVYATQIFSAVSGGGAVQEQSRLYDIATDGNTAYLVGSPSSGATVFPVTPTAYNADGTAQVSGYDITPNGGSDNVMLAINIPAFKANTNIITSPAVTTFCSGSGILPILGSKAEYLTPVVLGVIDSSPAPVPTHYQWQVAPTNSGLWSDIADSDVKDFTPEAPAVANQYCYRRLVRQTPFGRGFCVPAEDIMQISNSVCLTFSANNTHATNIPTGKYGICQDDAPLALSHNLTPSVDGSFGPYTYKLTSAANLSATVQGQSGTVAAAPGTINLNVSGFGDYILQVTDARDCTSFDTLVVENFNLDAGPATKFTCGSPTVQIGPVSLPATYINFPSNTFTWSPTAGLNNPNAVSPIFTHGLADGASVTKYLSFNGCVVDSVIITNEVFTPLPALPDLALCQGDTLRLGTSGTGTGSLLASQTGVTYEWAPGVGLVTNDEVNPILTTASAPAGVNVITYTLLARTGSTGCSSTTTQEVTVYRTPNQSFNIKQCMRNGCTPDSTLQFVDIGTPPEPGISYSWTATVVDDPTNMGNTGVPTDAEALGFLTNPTGSITDLDSGTPGLGYAAQHGYTITYVRTSFNTADPSCMRTDTTELSYCCGNGGQACALALGAVPTVSCGGPDNKIGPLKTANGGNYYWSRLDGQPLNNELFLEGTGTPLVNGGPHPFQVIANPSGVMAVDYRLLFVLNNPGVGDTCSIDIKVFPGAVSTPNIDYPSPQSVCQGNIYTIEGPVGQPALTYNWAPEDSFLTPADINEALPTIKGLNSAASVFVTVTDESTGCFVQDTVQFLVTPVEVEAGTNATFCTGGAVADIGSFQPIQGYTYQWSAVPAAGVTFGSDTAPTTTATLPATAVGSTIKLFLTATNGLTPANCMLQDSVVFTAAAGPNVIIPIPNALCSTGGIVTLGPISPTGPENTYTWSGPGIVSGQGTPTITANAIGDYSVIIGQGTCTGTASRTVIAATDPNVNLTVVAPCDTDAIIGATTMTAAEKVGWRFSWDTFDGMTANASDLSTITVRPTVTTTYTLTATHISGCVQTFPVVVEGAAYVASLPSNLNFCEGQPAVLPLNDFTGVGGSVVWTSIPAEATDYLSSTNAAQPTINLSTAPAGNYIFTATVTYGAGCTAVATTRVNIGKKIENIAGIDQEICEGNSVQLGITQIPGMSYQWSAMPTDAILVAVGSPRPTVSPIANTIYTLNYIDAAGCRNKDNVDVKINPSPVMTVTDIGACQNEMGAISIDLATSITSNNGISTDYWHNAAATIPLVSSTVTYTSTFYVQSTGANSCTTIKPVVVTIASPPNTTLMLSDTTICSQTDAALFLSNSEVGFNYQLRNNTNNSPIGSVVDGTGNTIRFIVPNLTSVGTYTYNVFVTDLTTGCGAEITDRAVVEVVGCDYSVFSNSCEDPACHFTDDDIYLGSVITPDAAGTGESTSDDGFIAPNDIRPNIQVNFPVAIYNETGETAYLSGWVDWNGDGDYDDAGEQVAQESYTYSAPNTGSYTVLIPTIVPIDAVQSQDLNVRWRLSTDNSVATFPCGTSICAVDGEVEDYLIRVECAQTICLPPTLTIRNGTN